MSLYQRLIDAQLEKLAAIHLGPEDILPPDPGLYARLFHGPPKASPTQLALPSGAKIVKDPVAAVGADAALKARRLRAGIIGGAVGGTIALGAIAAGKRAMRAESIRNRNLVLGVGAGTALGYGASRVGRK